MTTSQKICKNCVLPNTFPGILFNNEGLCNFCLDTNKRQKINNNKNKYKKRFEDLIKEYRNKSNYEVTMCYSGGKDSTYTMAILKEIYNLNIVAVTVDNGFLSHRTIENIHNIVEKLGISHIFIKPRFDMLSRIFTSCAETDIFSAKTLERASTICTACMAIVKFGILRFSIEGDIPFIAFGWSPGQAPITSAIMKNNPQMTKAMQRALYKPLYELVGEQIRPYFLEEKHFSGSYNFPYNIHPLAFLDYVEEEIYQKIGGLGWVAPNDVDANSTNCLLNSYANLVHKRRLGFHPYAFELAGLVREGYLDRESALTRLAQKENPLIITHIEQRLGIKGEDKK